MASISAAVLATNEEPFDGINPSDVIPLLLALPASDCINGITFWKSYKKWESLTPEQRNKAAKYWKTSITPDVRIRLSEAARAIIVTGVAEEKTRQAITSKDDLARLLHLRVDTNAAADWTNALREKNWAQLDVTNSGDQAADADPYNRLAAKFNDYETQKYQNACIVPNHLTVAGTYISNPGMQAIAYYCHDFNSCIPERPIRDGYWVRSKYKELKGKLSVCFNNYHLSGNQDAENIYDEWIKFSTAFNADIIHYARALFSDTEMDQIGRALPVEAQRDTGEIHEEDNAPDARRANADARKRQRRDASSSRSRRPSDSSTSDNSNVEEPSSSSSALSRVIQVGVSESNIIMRESQGKTHQLAALQLLLQYGNPEEKAEAMEKIRAIALA
eukprot:gene29171-38235_t